MQVICLRSISLALAMGGPRASEQYDHGSASAEPGSTSSRQGGAHSEVLRDVLNRIVALVLVVIAEVHRSPPPCRRVVMGPLAEAMAQVAAVNFGLFAEIIQQSIQSVSLTPSYDLFVEALQNVSLSIYPAECLDDTLAYLECLASYYDDAKGSRILEAYAITLQCSLAPLIPIVSAEVNMPKWEKVFGKLLLNRVSKLIEKAKTRPKSLQVAATIVSLCNRGVFYAKWLGIAEALLTLIRDRVLSPPSDYFGTVLRLFYVYTFRYPDALASQTANLSRLLAIVAPSLLSHASQKLPLSPKATLPLFLGCVDAFARRQPQSFLHDIILPLLEGNGAISTSSTSPSIEALPWGPIMLAIRTFVFFGATSAQQPPHGGGDGTASACPFPDEPRCRYYESVSIGREIAPQFAAYKPDVIVANAVEQVKSAIRRVLVSLHAALPQLWTTSSATTHASLDGAPLDGDGYEEQLDALQRPEQASTYGSFAPSKPSTSSAVSSLRFILEILPHLGLEDDCRGARRRGAEEKKKVEVSIDEMLIAFSCGDDDASSELAYNCLVGRIAQQPLPFSHLLLLYGTVALNILPLVPDWKCGPLVMAYRLIDVLLGATRGEQVEAAIRGDAANLVLDASATLLVGSLSISPVVRESSLRSLQKVVKIIASASFEKAGTIFGEADRLYAVLSSTSRSDEAPVSLAGGSLCGRLLQEILVGSPTIAAAARIGISLRLQLIQRHVELFSKMDPPSGADQRPSSTRRVVMTTGDLLADQWSSYARALLALCTLPVPSTPASPLSSCKAVALAASGPHAIEWIPAKAGRSTSLLRLLPFSRASKSASELTAFLNVIIADVLAGDSQPLCEGLISAVESVRCPRVLFEIFGVIAPLLGALSQDYRNVKYQVLKKNRRGDALKVNMTRLLAALAPILSTLAGHGGGATACASCCTKGAHDDPHHGSLEKVHRTICKYIVEAFYFVTEIDVASRIPFLRLYLCALITAYHDAIIGSTLRYEYVPFKLQRQLFVFVNKFFQEALGEDQGEGTGAGGSTQGGASAQGTTQAGSLAPPTHRLRQSSPMRDALGETERPAALLSSSASGHSSIHYAPEAGNAIFLQETCARCLASLCHGILSPLPIYRQDSISLGTLLRWTDALASLGPNSWARPVFKVALTNLIASNKTIVERILFKIYQGEPTAQSDSSSLSDAYFVSIGQALIKGQAELSTPTIIAMLVFKEIHSSAAQVQETIAQLAEALLSRQHQPSPLMQSIPQDSAPSPTKSPAKVPIQRVGEGRSLHEDICENFAENFSMLSESVLCELFGRLDRLIGDASHGSTGSLQGSTVGKTPRDSHSLNVTLMSTAFERSLNGVVCRWMRNVVLAIDGDADASKHAGSKGSGAPRPLSQPSRTLYNLALLTIRAYKEGHMEGASAIWCQLLLWPHHVGIIVAFWMDLIASHADDLLVRCSTLLFTSLIERGLPAGWRRGHEHAGAHCTSTLVAFIDAIVLQIRPSTCLSPPPAAFDGGEEEHHQACSLRASHSSTIGDELNGLDLLVAKGTTTRQTLSGTLSRAISASPSGLDRTAIQSASEHPTEHHRRHHRGPDHFVPGGVVLEWLAALAVAFAKEAPRLISASPEATHLVRLAAACQEGGPQGSSPWATAIAVLQGCLLPLAEAGSITSGESLPPASNGKPSPQDRLNLVALQWAVRCRSRTHALASWEMLARDARSIAPAEVHRYLAICTAYIHRLTLSGRGPAGSLARGSDRQEGAGCAQGKTCISALVGACLRFLAAISPEAYCGAPAPAAEATLVLATALMASNDLAVYEGALGLCAAIRLHNLSVAAPSHAFDISPSLFAHIIKGYGSVQTAPVALEVTICLFKEMSRHLLEAGAGSAHRAAVGAHLPTAAILLLPPLLLACAAGWGAPAAAHRGSSSLASVAEATLGGEQVVSALRITDGLRVICNVLEASSAPSSSLLRLLQSVGRKRHRTVGEEGAAIATIFADAAFGSLTALVAHAVLATLHILPMAASGAHEADGGRWREGLVVAASSFVTAWIDQVSRGGVRAEACETGGGAFARISRSLSQLSLAPDSQPHTIEAIKCAVDAAMDAVTGTIRLLPDAFAEVPRPLACTRRGGVERDSLADLAAIMDATTPAIHRLLSADAAVAADAAADGRAYGVPSLCTFFLADTDEDGPLLDGALLDGTLFEATLWDAALWDGTLQGAPLSEARGAASVSSMDLVMAFDG